MCRFPGLAECWLANAYINAMWKIDFPLPSESPSSRRLKVAFYLRLRAATVGKVEKHWQCEDLHQTLGLLHHSHPSSFLTTHSPGAPGLPLYTSSDITVHIHLDL